MYLLNFADSNFPSELTAGKSELLEEERRLSYVAMTHEKQDLHPICLLRYYVTHQLRTGDIHIYGLKSRFLSVARLKTLKSVD